jgi:ubiquinone/menaquinone biosynthesis C-methylase UbiE
MIDEMRTLKGAELEVLDIGGSVNFWLTLAETARAKCKISVVNLPGDFDGSVPDDRALEDLITHLTGDARNLSQFEDGAFDLIICNSVIEHVGSWTDMEAAAKEARRIGKRGWVQVPAFEFPLEQHFILPLVHWFAEPIQIKLLATLHNDFKSRSFHDQQMSVHHVRPLTRRQLSRLFPKAEVFSEWLICPKSHIAIW